MSITSKDDLLKKQIETREEINSLYLPYPCLFRYRAVSLLESQKIYDEMCRLCEGIDGVRGRHAERCTTYRNHKDRLPGLM